MTRAVAYLILLIVAAALAATGEAAAIITASPARLARVRSWLAARQRNTGRHCTGPRATLAGDADPWAEPSEAEAVSWLAAVTTPTPDPDADAEPCGYWPAYLPAAATPETPAAESPLGVQDEAATPSGVTAASEVPAPPAPNAVAGTSPALGDLVQSEPHWLQAGQPWPRGEHPYPPMAGNWKETREFEVVQDPHPVPRWYLIWLLRHPDGGPEITDADFNYAAGAA